MATGRTLKNVQTCRALAAFMVVFYHARLLTPIGSMISFDWGNAGVDIFFLISGFIIAHVTRLDDVGRPGAFLLKRAIRILPLYWLLTLALFVVAQKAPSLAGAGGRPDLAMLFKSLFFVPYNDASGQMHPVLFMGWTLDYEIFFYLVFATGLSIRHEAARLSAVTLALGTLVAAGALLHPTGPMGMTYTDPMMLEFVLGMWINLAWYALPARRLSMPAITGWLALAAAALVLLVAGDYGWPQVPREVKWGGPALLLFVAALALEHGGATIGWRWLMLLGEASYAVYLVHPFIIKAAGIVYGRLHAGALPVHAVALVGVYILVALVGIGFHLWIEKPVILRLRNAVVPRDPPSIVTSDPGVAPA